MPQLTEDEWRQLRDGTAQRIHGAFIRPMDNWQTILERCANPHEAAARIFGDMLCYQSTRGHKRRDRFLADVENLARALQAWATLKST
jgi:hypothetical protein